MTIMFFLLLFVLCLFAAGFIGIVWKKSSKNMFWIPTCLIIFTIIFSSIWYFYSGEGAHIIYQEEDQHLQQIAKLLETKTALAPEMLKNIKAELHKQESRQSAQPTVWLLEGQLAMRELNYSKASKAYQKAHAYAPDDPDIAINYAQAQYLTNGQHETPELKQLINQVQADYPEHQGLLNLQAAIAFNNKDYPVALRFWKTLMMQYPPSSPDALIVQQAIQVTEDKLKNSAE